MKRTNKKIIVGSLLIIGLTVVIVTLTLFNQKETFANEDFSFTIPSGWTQDDLEKGDLDKLLIIRFRQKDPKATFHVRTIKSGTATDLSALPKQLRSSFKNEVKNFEELKTGFQKIDGYEALRYEYKYEDLNASGKTFVTHQEMVITPVGDKIYYLVGQAKEEDYSKVRDKIQKIFDSFNFE